MCSELLIHMEKRIMDNLFIKTGCQNIEISTGDSPQRVEDVYEPSDHLSEIIYSKDLGSFKQEVVDADDMQLGRVTEPSNVIVHVETNEDYNFIHFEYEGGTGFSLRMPILVSNEESEPNLSTTQKEWKEGESEDLNHLSKFFDFGLKK